MTPQDTQRQSAAPNLHGCRILAVDDDANTLTTLRELLEMVGAVVETAPSGTAAWEILQARMPQVLISDLAMPQMSGLDLIDLIRASPRPDLRALPAVAVTGHVKGENRTEALAHGFQAHLPKPVDFSELMTIVRALAQSR